MRRAVHRFDDIEELFDQADEDDDDQISLTEFRGLMQEIGCFTHHDAWTTRFLEIDTNRDGRISCAEFRAFWLNH
jgi:Ca2+-binding EF-hand superfamily protein